MLYIGSHVGFDKKKQLLGSVEEALSYGETVFMFYTGAPQNTLRSSIEDGLTVEAMQLMKERGIDLQKVIVHAPYIINLANKSKIEQFQFSISFLTNELERCEALGISYLVLHPGSHVGAGVEQGIKNIADGLNRVFLNYQGPVQILLETMAGKGTEIGSKLEELAQIISLVDDSARLGICLDTCHLHDAGYNLQEIDDLLTQVDRIIGLSKVGCIHVNDSKNESGSHKDRHENFGFGTIGFDTLLKYIYDSRLQEVPKILETPYLDHKYPPYRYEIEMIRAKEFDPNLKDKIRS